MAEKKDHDVDKINCGCGSNEDDDRQVYCDKCNSLEHVTCRGLLQAPTGAHICLNCRDGTVSKENKLLCMKRRLLDHLRDSKSFSRKDVIKLFNLVEESEVVELWGLVRSVCNSGKGVSISHDKVEELWPSLFHEDYEPKSCRKKGKAKRAPPPPLQPPEKEQVTRAKKASPPPVLHCAPLPCSVYGLQKENKPPEKEQVTRDQLASPPPLQPPEKGQVARRKFSELEGENMRLKRKICELEEENKGLKRKIRKLEGVNTSPNATEDEVKEFIDDLRGIVGDSDDTVSDVLDKIHKRKKIGTAGYVKAYEQVFGDSKYHCVCGKGPLGSSGIYRHVKNSIEKNSIDSVCHPVPVEYYTVLQ